MVGAVDVEFFLEEVRIQPAVEDKFSWQADPSCDFTVKLCYFLPIEAASAEQLGDDLRRAIHIL